MQAYSSPVKDLIINILLNTIYYIYYRTEPLRTGFIYVYSGKRGGNFCNHRLSLNAITMVHTRGHLFNLVCVSRKLTNCSDQAVDGIRICRLRECLIERSRLLTRTGLTEACQINIKTYKSAAPSALSFDSI